MRMTQARTKGGDFMPELQPASASIRISDANGKLVHSTGGVNPLVTPEVAAGYTEAIETIYNNGPCKAVITVKYEVSS
jgi:hypothetical protein